MNRAKESPTFHVHKESTAIFKLNLWLYFTQFCQVYQIASVISDHPQNASYLIIVDTQNSSPQSHALDIYWNNSPNSSFCDSHLEIV